MSDAPSHRVPTGLAPEEVGLSAERLGRLDATLERYVDAGKLPGTQVLVSRRGHLVHRSCYGWTDVEAGWAVAPDTIYRIYSMTKPITSVALMMLYEQGELLLENPAHRFVPELGQVQVWEGGSEEAPVTRRPARPITVHDLLTHLSGLTYGFHLQHPVDALYRARGLGDFTEPSYDLAEGMARLAEVPLLVDPGTRWNYSMSTDVCGRIIEVVTGRPLDEALRTMVLDPLGMDQTAFSAPEDDLARCGPIYTRRRAGGLHRFAEPDAMTRPPTFLSGGGGLVSTADDYLRFCHALLGGGALDGTRLLGARTLAYMTSNHLPGGRLLNEMGQSTFSETTMEGTGFGLGFSVVVDPPAVRALCSAGEFGWGGAASTAFWVDPVEELCVVFMTQLLPSDTYPIRRQLRAGVYQALLD